jgi:hypothetical protein
VLQLQRTYGNSYVQRLLDSMQAQAVDVQRQEEEEEPVQAKPMVASVAPPVQHRSSPDVVQRGIWDKIRGWFRRKKPSEAELTADEQAEVERELERLMEMESRGEKSPAQELSDEEAEQEVAKLEEELEGSREEELSEEEAEQMLEELESEAEVAEEAMSPGDLKRAIDEAGKVAESLTERYERMCQQQQKLATQYAKLVVKKGKEKEAEAVNARFLEFTAELESVRDAADEAWSRHSELVERMNQLIGDILARPIGEEVDEGELEAELEELSAELEGGESSAKDRLKEQPMTSLPEAPQAEPEEDELKYLYEREPTPEELAQMEEEILEIEREMEDERIRQLLASMPEPPKTELGAAKTKKPEPTKSEPRGKKKRRMMLS